MEKQNKPNQGLIIGDMAFYGCSGLEKIELPSHVKSIGNRAFGNCTGVKAIYSYSTIPVDLSSSINVFENIDKIKCILYVPASSKSLYESANQWNEFKNIVEM